MNNHPLKLTTLAVAMLSSFHASAALYKVVEVSPSVSYGSSSYGTAVEDVASGFVDADNCFDSGTSCGDSDYSLAGETRRADGTQSGETVDGITFREEVPFGINDTFSLASGDLDFYDFCSAYLGYAYCTDWADDFSAEWDNEVNSVQPVNSYGFYEDSSGVVNVNYDGITDADSNTIITDLINGASSQTDENDVVGFDILVGSANKRKATSINPLNTVSIDSAKGARLYGYKDSYYFGSLLTEVTTSDGAYGTFYSSEPALWYGSYGSSDVATAPWGTASSTFSTAVDDYHVAQGSIRGIYVSGSTLYGVGYTTYDSDDHFMGATVFQYDVSGTPAYSTHVQVTAESLGDDSVYTKTLLTDVNDNGVAIGEAKLDDPDAGTYANKLFVIPSVTAPNTGVTIFSESIIKNISSAGGHANAINNYNEIVGQIDISSVRESDGKARRKRGFIYPYNDTTFGDIFNNKAWMLDDLTNGGTNSTANNYFRILSANDINDAGVIAATAIKCPGGYSSTTHDASCSGTEETVAVKLVPISGNSYANGDISARGYETTSISREGASFGLFGLAGLFGLLMYRRKK